MAATCPNCKKRLGCSCQLKKANDGTQCCTNCVGKYNLTKTSAKKSEGSKEETTGDAPSNVEVIYNGPGKQV